MASGDQTLLTPLAWGGVRAPGTTRLGIGPEVAALAFLFVLYANLAVIASDFYGVPEVMASSIALLLLFPIGKYVLIDREPLVITPVLPLVFVFLGALFLSATLSGDPGVAGRSVGTYLTEGLILYLLVSNAVRTTQTLNRVVWVLILAGSLMGAISIYQELTHTYANNYGGLAQVDRLDVGGSFNIAPQDSQEKILRPRLGGPLGSENRYAQIMVVLMPLALIRAFRERSRRRRLLAAGASFLILGGILLTFSRGAAVGLGAVLLLMVLLRELRLRHFALLLAVGTAAVLLVAPDYVIRVSSLQGVTSISASDESSYPDRAVLGRATENLAAWYTFLDHPLVGVGPGVYFHEYSREYANRLGLRYLESQRRGHSLYLEMAADIGLVGLGAFLAMVTAALGYLYRNARYWRERDVERSILASSFFFALLAYLATALFLQLSYQRYFWVLLALASSVIWALEGDRGRAERAEVRAS
ncbi:MAG TPA: O-antigen ligase family protein [Gaiellaceae bacterium]|jgi:O-antigen ligase